MLPFFNMKMMLPFFNMKFFPVIFEFEQQSMIMLQPLQLECLGDVGSPPSAQFALRPTPTPTPTPFLGDEGQAIFRTFMELLVGVIFFRQDLKTPYIKNSECDSQAKKKKKIPIVVSTISHFWFPAIANLWQSVFASLFSMVYTTLTTNIFLWGTNFFFFMSYSQELRRFQIYLRPSVLGGPNFLFGRGGLGHFIS